CYNRVNSFTSEEFHMSDKKTFLAMDFGASSGRAILGELCDGKLNLREIHRFSNDPVDLAGRLHWDLPRLFFEIKRARHSLIKNIKHSRNKVAFILFFNIKID
ncbi:MAG: hypothetical protein J6B55_07095, partial [Clostridia bacterium]|nr:hypothetical protein [Clostridia bacterium]